MPSSRRHPGNITRRRHGDAEPAHARRHIGNELGFGEGLEDCSRPCRPEFCFVRPARAAQTGGKAGKWRAARDPDRARLLRRRHLVARGRREMLRNVGVALLLVGILLLVIPGRRNYIVDALSSASRCAARSTHLAHRDQPARELAWALMLRRRHPDRDWLAGPKPLRDPRAPAIGPTLTDRPGRLGRLGAVYLLLVLWGPVPALRNWVGGISSCADRARLRSLRG